ncbi:MAG TPA: hypothetical protein VEX37_09580 [Thermomicrobiales bacterium]|nr:hypothetical protein [Thermomicrobiales bacterium]
MTVPQPADDTGTITHPNPIRAGVTGHRPSGLAGADLDMLRQRIREALTEIASTEPSVPLVVISPLAEGADQLIAREAVNAGYLLDCVLPFPRDDYASDFAGAAKRSEYYALLGSAGQIIELHGSRETPEVTDAAYMAAGEHVVEHADVIIAIWDGAEARGSGGTGDVVALALACSLPVLWIAAHQPHPLRLITRNGSGIAEQPIEALPGMIRF